ncbi:MAG: DUF4442 domain-containing protein [Gammaproteobacteria bacterium]
MNILRLLRKASFLSPARQLQLYPPFFLMGVKVIELEENWNRVRLRLPLTMLSKNMGSSMFGGYVAAVADPIAALACARQFPGCDVWTRTLYVDFIKPGNTHLELRFEFDPVIKQQIQDELASKGRSTPEFEYGLYREDDSLCSRVHCRVAIRPAGYKKPERANY